MKIKINEVFYSIQGEGFHSGTPAVFIRTAGCNLSCTFCDTDFSVKQTMEPSEILEQISVFPSKFAVITGGEPTCQSEAVCELITKLHDCRYYVCLETNGTSINVMRADWVTVSPKSSRNGEWLLRHGSEIKLVYEGQDLKPYEITGFDHYYLQPLDAVSMKQGRLTRNIIQTKQFQDAAVKAVKENPKWKLSVQIHKILGIK